MMWVYRVVKKLTEQELQAIKKRMNSADSGIWIADHKEWPGNSNLQYWVNSTELDGDGLCACVDIEDAEFIAHARQDIPMLVAEVERLREALEKAQSEIIPIRGYERKDIDGISSVCIKIRNVLEGEDWE